MLLATCTNGWAQQKQKYVYTGSASSNRGALCADSALASHWADQLLPLLHHVMAYRRNCIYAYARFDTLKALSALPGKSIGQASKSAPQPHRSSHVG